jgi:hypothetical protein
MFLTAACAPISKFLRVMTTLTLYLYVQPPSRIPHLDGIIDTRVSYIMTKLHFSHKVFVFSLGQWLHYLFTI